MQHRGNAIRSLYCRDSGGGRNAVIAVSPSAMAIEQKKSDARLALVATLKKIKHELNHNHVVGCAGIS